MRIMHTSDWHLGRTLHGLDLRAEQQRVLDQICDLVVSESIDCVVVAGDVFDRAVPPVEALTLFNDVVARMSEHATVIVTAGNHDSAIRLGHGSRFLRTGIHIVTNISDVGTGVDVPSRTGEEIVRFYPIPYLDPDHARYALRSDPSDEALDRSHQSVMSAAVDLIRADLTRYEGTPGSAALAGSVVIAHAFVTGATPSDSERDIKVGGFDNVGAAVFSGFTYTALGHLHGPQVIETPGEGVVRYSGSPLRYSFSEATHSKGVVIVDIAAGRSTSHSFVDLDQPREMCQLTGTLEEILSPTNVSAHQNDWVRAIVVDSARPNELNSRIRSSYPHALSIVHEPTGGLQTFGRADSVINLTDPVEISQVFIADVTAREATVSEVGVLNAAYESARTRSLD